MARNLQRNYNIRKRLDVIRSNIVKILVLSNWDLHIQPLLKEYLRGTVNPENDLARLQDAYNLKFIEKTPEIAEQPATES